MARPWLLHPTHLFYKLRKSLNLYNSRQFVSIIDSQVQVCPRIFMPVNLALQLMLEVLSFEGDAALKHGDGLTLLLGLEGEVAVLSLKLLAFKEVSENKH